MKPITKSAKLANVLYDIRGPIMDAAKQMEEEGQKLIKLNIGNLAVFGFDAPEEVQQDMIQKLKVMLYRFLNPITGGVQGQGWEFGRPVYPSDIIKLLQNVQGVRFLGTVQLFELRYEDGQWMRRLSPQPIIDPSPTGLICSWSSPRFRSNHIINIV